MALANVALTDTFDVWRIRTNQLVTEVNVLDIVVPAAFNQANAAPGIANTYATAIGISGNSYATSVGTSGNTYARSVGTSGNTYATSVGTSGNTYASSVGVGANTYATSVGTSGNTYTLAAFNKANNALANASGTFSGNLLVTGDISPASVTNANLNNSLLTTARETMSISATAATGTINYNALSYSSLYYTTNASGGWTLNVRANSTISLDTAMSTGQTLTIAFVAAQGAPSYWSNTLNIDGSIVSVKWQGNTKPTSATNTSTDIYTYTILKTGSATFTTFGAKTNFGPSYSS